MKPAKPIPTLERLRQLCHYDPDTGLFTRKVGIPGHSAGEKAGQIATDGYVRLKIDGHRYLGHLLAFLWMTGEWPCHEVDHRDLSRSNLRWNNLRPATRSLNGANKALGSTNTSGFKGVTFHRSREKWMAKIQVNGKTLFLGYFAEPADAHAAYVVAARHHFGEYARAA